ncbi:hypothetical protein PFISCL1PPCAC_6717, partial [Pristionchus fissidentatus]
DNGGTVVKKDSPIFYRDPETSDHFIGPFNEAKIQSWYKDGFFHSKMEFRIGKDVYNLEHLRSVNGIGCPFSFPIEYGKDEKLAVIIDRLQDEVTVARNFVARAQSEFLSLKKENKSLTEKLDKLSKNDAQELLALLGRVQVLEEYREEFEKKMMIGLENQTKRMEEFRDVQERNQLAMRIDELEASHGGMNGIVRRFELEHEDTVDRLRIHDELKKEFQKMESHIRKSISDSREMIASTVKSAAESSVYPAPLQQNTDPIAADAAIAATAATSTTHVSVGGGSRSNSSGRFSERKEA